MDHDRETPAMKPLPSVLQGFLPPSDKDISPENFYKCSFAAQRVENSSCWSMPFRGSIAWHVLNAKGISDHEDAPSQSRKHRHKSREPGGLSRDQKSGRLWPL
jgi:hypothetical protein